MTDRYLMVLERLFKYRVALEQIASLAGITKSHGIFEQMFTPDYLIDDDGWGPVHPKFKQGVRYVARIAQKALEEEE